GGESYVNDLLVPHRFDDANFSFRSVLAVATHFDMLRANTEKDATARLSAARNVECEIDSLEGAHSRAPAFISRALDHSFDEVHRRAADEAGDEFVQIGRAHV